MATKSFKFVYIPVDNTQPMEEWEQEMEEGKEVESLTHRLQEHFRKVAAPGGKEYTEEKRRMLQQHAKGIEITDDMMKNIGNLQMVETVALLSGSPGNGFNHVNMYVDDSGLIKKLPINQRASALATTAGFPCTIHGDAFVARTVDSDADFTRLDFTLNELDSGAAWIAEAKAANRRRQENAGKLEEMGVSGMQPVNMGKLALEEQEQDEKQKPVDGKVYTWSQQGDEVSIEVRVPPETKAKDVKCDVKANSIEVSVATLPADQREVLKGTLFQTVSTDDCSWTIANVDGGRVLQIMLTKQIEMRWLGVLR